MSLTAAPADDLTAFFRPRSVALVGATERPGTVGRALLDNLAAFPGTLTLVNAKHRRVLDREAVPSLRECAAGSIDLAIIATPASTVPGVIADCAAIGVRAAIVISAGFKETGAAGLELEREVLAAAQDKGLRLIGPNCLGVMAPHAGLNASFASTQAAPGRVAFLSQSGALCTAILDWSHAQRVGFSAFVSLGSMLDVGWGDLIRHFGRDADTSSIVIYMESVGDAASFMAAAAEVAATKPIIVIKVGRCAEAARAAASHTGAMTGSDAVLDAAFRRLGIVRVESVEELFDMAEVLAKQPLPGGPRLGIVTNAGGPGALATDAIVLAGGSLATLQASTLATLDAALPAHWSHGNPVDVLGDAGAERFATAFQAVAADSAVDGLLAILTPQAMTQAEATAKALAEVAATTDKPVLASWMGEASVKAARAEMNAAGLPTYDYPDEAARAFQLMWQRQQRLGLLEETRRLGRGDAAALMELRARVLDTLPDLSPRLLDETEAKQLLQAAGINCVPTQRCHSEEEAVSAAAHLGKPVALKLLSHTITHKSDVGGVRLNLTSPAEVRAAWQAIQAAVPAADFEGVSVQPMVKTKGLELIVGASRDAQFGPVLLFGAGGVLVEIMQDRALALPPLSPVLVRDWIGQTRIAKALQGVRGQPPADLSALESTLIALSQLVLALPEIAELDINPLLASAEGVIALDARVRLGS